MKHCCNPDFKTPQCKWTLHVGGCMQFMENHSKMASSLNPPSTVLAINLKDCKHQKSKQFMSAIANKTVLQFLFEEHHEPLVSKHSELEIYCRTNLSNGDNKFKVDGCLTVSDLLKFDVKLIEFHCLETDGDKESDSDGNRPPGLDGKQGTSTEMVYNAFQILMTGGKINPERKTGMLNRKQELYNDLVDLFISRKLTFHKYTMQDDSTYILQVLTNALWYITNQHTTIEEASQNRADVIPVPPTFEKYQGYNDFKRKKLKSQPLEQNQLDSHAQALFNLCTRPLFRSTQEWCEMRKDIELLAKCFDQYRLYLVKQLGGQKDRQMIANPVRSIGTDIVVEHREKAVFGCKEKYKIFDRLVSSSTNPLDVIFFDENIHLEKPFQNYMQRHRYFDEIQLSCQIDLYRYCPGGSVVTIVFVTKVPQNRTKAEELAHPIKVVQKVRDKLPEFHTRAQKAHFRKKLQNLTGLKGAVVEFIYKELALDASVASHPETQERLNLIALGQDGLVTDLRSLNAGRPSQHFDEFFGRLEEVVDKVTAVDDRRHGLAHLSHWISLNEMITEAVELCSDDAPIPSKTLVRLQFAPRNPYLHSAVNFTSRIPVQYKIQRRQLRASHPDQHYCAAQFKYMKCKAIELGENGMMVCCDDKAKVPVGDPGLPVSTGVRGKKSIAPATTTLVSSDHDMTKCSITPSVYLQCKTPESPEKSFVSGQVSVVVNDSVLQQSNPFRHAVVMCKLLQKRAENMPKILLKFSDGGTDQRNTLESVKCASICIFKELNLDMLILGRCAPGNSWINPAERVMSILNLGLQNCALERDADDGNFKSCNSMSQIRDKINKTPNLKDEWVSSIEPVQSLVRNRFQRLTLKGQGFVCLDPVTDDDIDLLKRHLRELFPDLKLDTLQKQHTKSVMSYQTWMESHCRQRHYNFQVRKCSNSDCCIPPTSPPDHMVWLPDPMFLDQEHYKPYDEIKNSETTDSDRPSYVEPCKQSKANMKGVTAVKPHTISSVNEHASASLYTAQNARFTVECTECRKPRMIYSKSKLTDWQRIHLALLVSEYEYTCGSLVTVPGDMLHKVVFVREMITCNLPIELSFYSSDIGRPDLCSFCAAPDSHVVPDLKNKFKTVLPICGDCSAAGFRPICQRPYGKKSK